MGHYDTIFFVFTGKKKGIILTTNNQILYEEKKGISSMRGVNSVNILGRVGADPEVKIVGNDKTVARFSVATSEVWTKDGEKQEKTEWHRIVVWGKLAEIIGKHVEKGMIVFVQGKIQTRQWEDEQGKKNYSTEIIGSQIQFVGGKGGERSSGSGEGRSSSKSSEKKQRQESNYDDQPDFSNNDDDGPNFDSDDDIPF